MNKNETNELLRDLIRRYVVAKDRSTVFGREAAEEYTYCKGVLVGACMVLVYEIVELKNCISLKIHNSGRIVLTEFTEGLVF